MAENDMKVALLINDRESREDLSKGLETEGRTTDEYATAAKALGMLCATRYDLILMHWKVHPGQRPGDPQIKELATLIPVVSRNRNVLYWETALRIIDMARMEDSPNRATPIMVIFPDLGQSTFESQDRLSEEAVQADLAAREPATLITEMRREDILAAVEQQLANT